MWRGRKPFAFTLSAAAATLCAAAAQAFSPIWYNEKDCRALVTGDKYACVYDD